MTLPKKSVILIAFDNHEEIAMQKRNRILALILTISLLSLTACAYRPPVQQGNVLTDKAVQSIHRGMSKHAVLRVLGKPVLTNIYRNGHLVYVYTLKPNRKAMQERQLLIYFRGSRVVNFKVFSTPNLKPPV